MGIGDELLNNLPAAIDRDDPVISALFSDEKGNGAIVNALSTVADFIDSYTTTEEINEQKGTVLDKTALFFTGIQRNAEETDDGYLRRVKTVAVRNNDLVFGTSWNMKSVFQRFFRTAAVHVIENTLSYSEDNLLVNYDFEEEGGWIFSGAVKEAVARFSGETGAKITNGYIEQQVNNLKGTYFLHFFLYGKCYVSIRDSTNKYWNEEAMAWQISPCQELKEANVFSNISMFFITEDTKNITIRFSSVTGYQAYIDYCGLFFKNAFSSFAVIVAFSGEAKGKLFSAAPGTSDPTIDIQNYDNVSYFSQDFLQGIPNGITNRYYEQVLQNIKPMGVKAYLVFIESAI